MNFQEYKTDFIDFLYIIELQTIADSDLLFRY
jgi:hypothetical protein